MAYEHVELQDLRDFLNGSTVDLIWVTALVDYTEDCQEEDLHNEDVSSEVFAAREAQLLAAQIALDLKDIDTVREKLRTYWSI